MELDLENITEGEGETTFTNQTTSNNIEEKSQKEIAILIAQQIFDFPKHHVAKVIEQLSVTLSTDHLESYLLIEKAYETGELYFCQEKELLEKINEIKITHLSDEQLLKLFKIKFYIAGSTGAYELVEQDTKLFLQKYIRNADKDLYDGVMLLRANGAARKGKKELAYKLYKTLLLHQDNININTYAWAARGIAILLDTNDPESYRYHEISVDAFLQSGQRIQAVKSIYAMAEFKEQVNLEFAFNLMKEADELLNLDGSPNLVIRAASHRKKARVLLKLKEYQPAISEIEKSIEIYSDLFGYKDELFSSLVLASEIYELLNDLEKLEILKCRQEEIKPFLQDKNCLLKVKFIELTKLKNNQLINDLQKKVENQDKDLQIAFHIFNAEYNSDLDEESQLEAIDHAFAILKSNDFSNEVWASVCLVAALTYTRQGLDDRAIKYYQRTLEYDSLDFTAIQNLVALLQRNQRWIELSIFLEKQREQFGDSSALLFWYGDALLKLGKANQAVPILMKSLNLAKEYRLDNIKYIEEVFYEAAASATSLDNELLTSPIVPRIIASRKNLEMCLDDFTDFLQTDKRMTFWSFDKQTQKHKWIKNPEQTAQNLLHTFIKAYFKEEVDILEEINTGAGRIDIFLRFSNNFSTIIELKMCGSPYSKNYAEEGLQQLSHYMSNKRTSLGYLIVFDSRSRDFGKGLSEVSSVRNHTVFTKIIDVRPTVKA